MKTFFVLAALGVTLFACSAEPDASETSRATVESESLYAAVCGFGLASYDPEMAIRFYARASVDEAGGLSIAMKPLVGWDAAAGVPRPPASVSQDQTCGTEIRSSARVDADGVFSARFGALDIPAAGNSINGVYARVQNLVFDGRYSAGPRFCTGFSGTLVVPGHYEFVRDENTCLFVRVNEGDSLPGFTAEDFHCP